MPRPKKDGRISCINTLLCPNVAVLNYPGKNMKSIPSIISDSGENTDRLTKSIERLETDLRKQRFERRLLRKKVSKLSKKNVKNIKKTQKQKSRFNVKSLEDIDNGFCESVNDVSLNNSFMDNSQLPINLKSVAAESTVMGDNDTPYFNMHDQSPFDLRKKGDRIGQLKDDEDNDGYGSGNLRYHTYKDSLLKLSKKIQRRGSRLPSRKNIKTQNIDIVTDKGMTGSKIIRSRDKPVQIKPSNTSTLDSAVNKMIPEENLDINFQEFIDIPDSKVENI